MSLFRDYATSTAFRVELTPPQAMTVWLIGRGEEGGPGYIESLGRNTYGRASTHSVQISRVLCERGLAEHHDRPPYSKEPPFTLTEAGWLVLALLRVAGVVPAKGAGERTRPSAAMSSAAPSGSTSPSAMSMPSRRSAETTRSPVTGSGAA